MFLSKKKGIIFVITVLFFIFFYSFFTLSGYVKGGYDSQSKIVEILKSIIPQHYVKKINNKYL